MESLARCANKDEAAVLEFFRVVCLQSQYKRHPHVWLNMVRQWLNKKNGQFNRFFKREYDFGLFKMLLSVTTCYSYLPPCCIAIPNIDFIAYTLTRFGAIRYEKCNLAQLTPEQYDVNMVVVANDSYDSHAVGQYMMEPTLVLKLSQFIALTVLIMVQNGLDDRCIKNLVTLPLPHLHNLVLSNNKIGSEGACDLVEMLLENTVLRSLMLNGNRIMSAGVMALTKLISNNTNLQVLGLCNNPFDIVADLRSVNQGYLAHSTIANQFQTALMSNVMLDTFQASPFLINFDWDRIDKRQKMLMMVACAMRKNVFLSDDLWLRSLQMLFSTK